VRSGRPVDFGRDRARHITSDVDAGAPIRLVADRSLYPMVASRLEGTETPGPAARWPQPPADEGWISLLGLSEREQPVPELRCTLDERRTDFVRRPVES
jgi:hypothetical protein